MTGSSHPIPGLRDGQARRVRSAADGEAMSDGATLTGRSGHGRRVAWFPDRALRTGPCLIATVAPDPVAIAPRLAPAQAGHAASALRARVQADEAALRARIYTGEAALRARVQADGAALLRIWYGGPSWTRDGAKAFPDALATMDAG